jgi:hypothetical protein
LDEVLYKWSPTVHSEGLGTGPVIIERAKPFYDEIKVHIF